MPKELKNIKEDVMSQIKSGQIKMRPKIYFVIGAIFTFAGLIISVATSVFLIGLMRFASRSYGPGGGFKLQYMISNFPWWISMVAILGLIVGIIIIRRYNFSYKINFKIIVVLFVLSAIISGWIIDVIGVNDVLLRQGPKPVRGIMKEHFQKNNIQSDSINSFPRFKNL